MVTSTPRKNEFEPLGKLPMAIVDETNHLVIHADKIQSILKNQLHNILSGKTIDLKELLLKELQNVHNASYSKGMRHMDLMHNKMSV